MIIFLLLILVIYFIFPPKVIVFLILSVLGLIALAVLGLVIAAASTYPEVMGLIIFAASLAAVVITVALVQGHREASEEADHAPLAARIQSVIDRT